MKYILDTNVLIRSKNDMPMDLWPTFWTKFTDMVMRGLIYSISKVKVEVEKGKDELTTWIKERIPKSFFLDLDEDIIAKYREVQNWASCRSYYKPEALNDFAEVADAYLIATAAAKQMTLVTYEKSDPKCKSRVKIPDACIALGVQYCDLNTVLREVGIMI